MYLTLVLFFSPKVLIKSEPKNEDENWSLDDLEFDDLEGFGHGIRQVSTNTGHGRLKKTLKSNKRRRPLLSKEEKAKRVELRRSLKLSKYIDNLDKTYIEDTRGEKQILRCKICLVAYKKESSLSAHFRGHLKLIDMKGNVNCPLCNESISKVDLTTHFIQNHSTPVEHVTCCVVCLEVMTHNDWNTLREHMVSKHEEAKVFSKNLLKFEQNWTTFYKIRFSSENDC